MKSIHLLIFTLSVISTSAQVSVKQPESNISHATISFQVKSTGRDSKDFRGKEIITNSSGRAILDAYGNYQYENVSSSRTILLEKVYCSCNGKVVDSIAIARYSDDTFKRIYLDNENKRSIENSFGSLDRLKYVMTDRLLRQPSCNKAYNKYRGTLVFNEFGTTYSNISTRKAYKVNEKGNFRKYLGDDCPINIESKDCSDPNLADQLMPYITVQCYWRRPSLSKNDEDVFDKVSITDSTLWVNAFNQYVEEIQKNGENSMYTGFMVCGRQIKWKDFMLQYISYIPNGENPTWMGLIPRRFSKEFSIWLASEEEERKKNNANYEKLAEERKLESERRKKAEEEARKAAMEKEALAHKQDIERLYVSTRQKDAGPALVSDEVFIVDSKTNQRYNNEYKDCASANPKKDFYQVWRGYANYRVPPLNSYRPVSYPDTTDWLATFNKERETIAKDQKKNKTGYMVCGDRLSWKDFVVVESIINPDGVNTTPGNSLSTNYHVVMVPKGYEDAYRQFKIAEKKREDAMFAPIVEKLRSRYVGHPAPTSLTENQQKAAEFMQKVIEAYGGMKRFQTINTLTKVFNPDEDGTYRINAIPNSRELTFNETDTQAGVYRFVIANQKGFLKHFEEQTKRGNKIWDMWYKKGGDVKASIILDSYQNDNLFKAHYDIELELQHDPFFYSERPSDFSWKGTEELYRTCVAVRIEDNGYPKRSLFFNPVTYHLERSITEIYSYPENKVNAYEVCDYYNYKPVDGILYPSVIIRKITDPKGNAASLTVQRYIKIEHNAPVTDRLFETGKN